MLNLFETYDIKPIFVFDGKSLSMKKNTISKRITTRK
jgi:5'-3' exonuclease